MQQAESGRSRRTPIVLTILIAAAASAAMFGWLHARPTPPEVDLRDANASLAEAVGAARAAVLREPERADLWGQLGMILYQHRFAAEARACFAQAERLNPHEPRWPYLTAQIDRVDDAPAAIAALERAITADPDSALVRLQLAERLLEEGRLDDAEQHFRAVPDCPRRQLPFDDARAMLGLARLALLRDQLDQALELAQRSAQGRAVAEGAACPARGDPSAPRRAGCRPARTAPACRAR